jgi:hypothetical protein
LWRGNLAKTGCRKIHGRTAGAETFVAVPVVFVELTAGGAALVEMVAGGALVSAGIPSCVRITARAA